MAVATFVALLGVMVWLGRPPAEEPEARFVQPVGKRLSSQFEVFENVQMAVGEPEEFAGHRFPFNDGNRARYALHLYFVESPEPVLTEKSSPQLARLARHFGNVPLDTLLEMGAEARDFSLRQMAERPFRVATTFEGPEEEAGVRANIMGFVLLKTADGGDEYLCEVLVREGYAAVTGRPAHLPFGEPRDVFLDYLLRLESEARKARKGIWAVGREAEE